MRRLSEQRRIVRRTPYLELINDVVLHKQFVETRKMLRLLYCSFRGYFLTLFLQWIYSRDPETHEKAPGLNCLKYDTAFSSVSPKSAFLNFKVHLVYHFLKVSYNPLCSMKSID